MPTTTASPLPSTMPSLSCPSSAPMLNPSSSPSIATSHSNKAQRLSALQLFLQFHHSTQIAPIDASPLIDSKPNDLHSLLNALLQYTNATHIFSLLSYKDLPHILAHLPAQAIAIIFALDRSNLAYATQTKAFISILHHIYTHINPSQSPSKHLARLHTQAPHALHHAIIAMQGTALCYASKQALQESKPLLSQLIATKICEASRIQMLCACIDTLTHTPSNAPQASKPQIEANTLKQEFLDMTDRLMRLLPHKKSLLQQYRENLTNARFSIGVAGVLSAGKSSFLNALLGAPILGTSSIPETASLTILRYGEQESAKVSFFSPLELEHLTLTQEQKDLINQGSITIALHDLIHYTSANDASRLSALVKHVELALPLVFLRNHVEIVDTPGLDDPIIIREEITRTYMRKCDMLIYVMNASCAATQKDIDFILESLISGHVARLCIILTRIDLLSKQELEASLNYTRKSLYTEIQKARYDGDIDSLLDAIDFFPLAALYGLGYKMNDEAIIKQASQQGFTLESSGITAIEHYLEAMLFGEHAPKQKDLLYSAYRALAKELEAELEALSVQLHIINASQADKQALAEQLREQGANLTKSLHSLQEQLRTLQDSLSTYLNELFNLLQAHLLTHIKKLHTQLYDDAIYEYKHHRVPHLARIQSIIHQSLYDSYHDLLREYKYKIAKKLRTLNELTLQDISLHNISLQASKSFHISMNDDMLQDLTTNLANQIHSIISSHNKRTQEQLNSALSQALHQGMGAFITIVAQENTRVSTHIQEHFHSITSAHEDALKQRIKQHFEAIDTALQHPSDIASLQEQHEVLQSIYNEAQLILKAL